MNADYADISSYPPVNMDSLGNFYTEQNEYPSIYQKLISCREQKPTLLLERGVRAIKDMAILLCRQVMLWSWKLEQLLLLLSWINSSTRIQYQGQGLACLLMHIIWIYFKNMVQHKDKVQCYRYSDTFCLANLSSIVDCDASYKVVSWILPNYFIQDLHFLNFLLLHNPRAIQVLQEMHFTIAYSKQINGWNKMITISN